MWELDHKEDRMPTNWFFWTVLEKTLESPLGCKEIKPVNPKGNQPWIFIGRNDADVEAPILWPLDAKNRLIRKDDDARKVWSKRSGWQRMRWLDSIRYSVDMDLSKLWKVVKDRNACLAEVHGVTKIRIWLSNWTTKTVFSTSVSPSAACESWMIVVVVMIVAVATVVVGS